MKTPSQMLNSTPYLVPEDDQGVLEFNRTAIRSADIADLARRVVDRIGSQATGLLEPLLRMQRSELVAESNQIEGFDVSRRQVLEAVSTHRELLNGDVHGLMQAMRADPKIVNELGLYKAQELADEWARVGQRPRGHEMRQLHALVTVDDRIGGRYRTRTVGIGGTKFRPPEHFEVPHAMQEFADWWNAGTSEPVLDATVAHAWLTHIHPFEDGNGRLARILANLALTQAGYPPLIVRAGADRGQYYDALAGSDDGNIMPLYTLFASVIRRTVKTMSAPTYTQDFLADRLLASVEDQRSAWAAMVANFTTLLRVELDKAGWTLDLQGLPDRTSFQLLADRDVDGNGWYAVIRDRAGSRRWLLWFGFSTVELIDLLSIERTGYPSIFVSKRDTRPGSTHPYVHGSQSGLFDEILLKPLEGLPAYMRKGYDVQAIPLSHAAKLVVGQLTQPQ